EGRVAEKASGLAPLRTRLLLCRNSAREARCAVVRTLHAVPQLRVANSLGSRGVRSAAVERNAELSRVDDDSSSRRALVRSRGIHDEHHRFGSRLLALARGV